MKILQLLDKTLLLLGKIAIFFVGGIVVIYICFVVFLKAATWLWPAFYGSYSLGNNIYMLEEDKGRKTIVNGTTIKGNTCYSGDQLIPTYENQYDSVGNFAEYVVDARADDNWIIAKTGNMINNQRKYYILNKSYNPDKMTLEKIISTRIECFTDSNKFAEACNYRKIDLKW